MRGAPYIANVGPTTVDGEPIHGRDWRCHSCNAQGRAERNGDDTAALEALWDEATNHVQTCPAAPPYTEMRSWKRPEDAPAPFPWNY